MWRRICWFFLILLTACSAASEPEGASTPISASTSMPAPNLGEAAIQEAEKGTLSDDSIAANNRRVLVEDNYSFGFSLGFDSIQPIYSPEFAPASAAPLEDDELVLGIAWDGEAKAYPISVLRYREMVDDELAGIPTLVTW